MEREREPVGPADLQYNDWKGTVALDDPDDENRLYELARLSRNEWTIVGIDFFGGYDSSWAVVYAIERSRVSEFDDWARVAGENDGLIPVTRIEIHSKTHDVGLAALSMFKRWDIHARLASGIHAQGFDLTIEREAEPIVEPD